MCKISPLLLALWVSALQAGGMDNAVLSQPILRMSLSLGSGSDTPLINGEYLAIERVPMGSGLQNATGIENADPVADFGVWHVPQYMPGFPTAATVWPRVVHVLCSSGICAGYSITTEMGRGEYLFFKPVDVD